MGSLDRNLYSSYNSQTNSRSQSPSMPDYDSINFTRTSSSRFSSRANTPDRPPQHSMYRGIAGSGTISPAAIAAPPRSLSSPGQLKSTLLTTPYDVLATQGGQSVSVAQSASTPPPRPRSPSPFNSSSAAASLARATTCTTANTSPTSRTTSKGWSRTNTDVSGPVTPLWVVMLGPSCGRGTMSFTNLPSPPANFSEKSTRQV